MSDPKELDRVIGSRELPDVGAGHQTASALNTETSPSMGILVSTWYLLQGNERTHSGREVLKSVV